MNEPFDSVEMDDANETGPQRCKYACPPWKIELV